MALVGGPGYPRVCWWPRRCEIETHLHDVLDVRLAALPPQTKALVRSTLTTPEATESMSAFLNERTADMEGGFVK